MQELIEQVEKEVETYIAEAKTLLPDLPNDISFVWDKSLVISGNGTGGTLLEPTVIGIGYDPDFDDKEKLSINLRASVLHECYHAVQGWSDQNPKQVPETLLEDGVLEGAATVFERQVAGTTPPWGTYEDDATMQKWLNEIKVIKLNSDSEQYTEYKFGSVHGIKWMLYKLGTWVVDKSLAQNPGVSVVELAQKKPKEIIELAGIELI